MAGLPRVACLVGLVGCAVPGSGEPLSRLSGSLADETSEAAAPAVTATLVVGAVAAELCAHQGEEIWSGVAAGDALPLSAGLQRALGDPVVVSLQSLGTDEIYATVTGVSLYEQRGAVLSLSTELTGGGMSLSVVAEGGGTGEEDTAAGSRATDTGDAVLEGVVFGRLDLVARQGCEVAGSWVKGTARWTNAEGRAEALTLPPEDALSPGLSFTADAGWIPVAGSLGWSGRARVEDRALVTEDASAIVLEGTDAAPAGRWPAQATGEDWESETIIAIGL